MNPKRSRVRDIATLCTVLFTATGCRGVMLTADVLTNPVLFGPVRSLGPRPVDGNKQVKQFISETTKSVTTVVTNVDTSGSTPTATAENIINNTDKWQMIGDIRQDGNEYEYRYIVLTSINCGAYFAFPLFFMRDHAWCKATGNVYESPLPPGTGTVAEPESPPFDTKAARNALDASAAIASSCPSGAGPVEVEVTITFVSWGIATSVKVGGDDVAKTAEEECIVKAFEGATVPAFEGEPVTLKKKVSLGKP